MMIKTFHKILPVCLVTIFILLLSGCRAFQSEPVPTPSAAPSYTLAPDRTSSPTLTQDTALMPTPTPEPIRTGQYADKVLIEEPLAGCDRIEYSADKAWAVGQTCQDDEIRLVSLPNFKIWLLHNLTTNDRSIIPTYVSPDGRTLYLAFKTFLLTQVSYYNDGDKLLRLDLESGEISEVLPFSGVGVYSFAFSPDGNKLAYILIGTSPMVLTILDLVSGEESHGDLPERFNRAGNILWAPQADRLVFEGAFMENPLESIGLKMKYSVILIDVTTRFQRTLVSRGNQEWTPILWREEDRIELRNEKGACRVYDLTAGAFTDPPCKGEK
jgi:hypothetical protein